MTHSFEESESRRKIAIMNEHLETRFGITIDTSSTELLEFVRQNYADRKNDILRRYTLSEASSMEDYVKAVMVSEAAGMFLREIAPTRTKPRKRPRKDRP